MLPLEHQVITLKQAKKLKELGVKHESLFYWASTGDDDDFHLFIAQPIKTLYLPNYYYEPGKSMLADDRIEETYSAFTLSELFEICSKVNKFYVGNHLHTEGYQAEFLKPNRFDIVFHQHENPVWALVNSLISFFEEKLKNEQRN